MCNRLLWKIERNQRRLDHGSEFIRDRLLMAITRMIWGE